MATSVQQSFVRPHMTVFDRKISLRIATATIAISLTACAVRSPVWSDSDEAGPPLTSGAPTRQVQKCDVASIQLFPASRTCEYAFASQDGTHVSFAELHREVSNSLGLASQLRPHLIEFRKQYQPSQIKWVRYPDFRLYVIALRPTVIVAVPASSHLSAGCYAPGGKECFRISDPRGWNGPTFSGWSTGVYYSKRPPVVDGAFAYIPATNAEAVDLPVDQRAVNLGTIGRELKLVNMDGLWQIQP